MTLGYWEVNVYIIFLFVFCRLRWLVPLLCLLSLVDFGSSEDRVHVRNEYGQLVTSSTLLWMPANSTLMPNYTVSAAEDPVLRKYRNAPTALTLVLSAARFARNANVLGNSSISVTRHHPKSFFTKYRIPTGLKSSLGEDIPNLLAFFSSSTNIFDSNQRQTGISD